MMARASSALDVLEKIGLGSTPPDPREALTSAQIHPRVIEDFRPLCESLEWSLSEAFWQTAGLRGFLRNEVPYSVNNSGSLSAQAAELLFANCLEFAPAGNIAILEIGAGTGLFARYLLDEFREMCRQRGADFYERLTFFVSDRSPRTVEQWENFGVFAEYETHVITGVCDARTPGDFRSLRGAAGIPSGLRAIFANYVLDSLPAAVLRKGTQGPEEQYIRTHLADSDQVLQYTTKSIEEIRQLAASPSPEDRAQLLPLVSVLEFESEFRPVNSRILHVDEAVAFGHNIERIVLNHAAFDAITKFLELSAADGFVLINDYGAITPEQIAGQAGTQRFGSSAAIGLNFPLLEHHFRMQSIQVSVPERDDLLSVHPRLLMRGEASETTAAFLRIFDGRAQRVIEECESEGRAHMEAARVERAREAYERALELRPRDWRLIGEVAEFVIRTVRDYEAGMRLAHAALTMNPWYSVWLWNVLGDALFALERYHDAHQAYLAARRIDANDPRTSLNLAYTHTQFGEFPQALEAIATGLAADTSGIFRQRLLEKQQHVLTLAAQRFTSEQEWQARRLQRLAQ
jgi:tetratricopeptide (TPR) repeat protein